MATNTPISKAMEHVELVKVKPDYKKAMRDEHKYFTEYALKFPGHGLNPVPDHVLTDYPDLKAKYRKGA